MAVCSVVIDVERIFQTGRTLFGEKKCENLEVKIPESAGFFKSYLNVLSKLWGEVNSISSVYRPFEGVAWRQFSNTKGNLLGLMRYWQVGPGCNLDIKELFYRLRLVIDEDLRRDLGRLKHFGPNSTEVLAFLQSRGGGSLPPSPHKLFPDTPIYLGVI